MRFIVNIIAWSIYLIAWNRLLWSPRYSKKKSNKAIKVQSLSLFYHVQMKKRIILWKKVLITSILLALILIIIYWALRRSTIAVYRVNCNSKYKKARLRWAVKKDNFLLQKNHRPVSKRCLKMRGKNSWRRKQRFYRNWTRYIKNREIWW